MTRRSQPNARSFFDGTGFGAVYLLERDCAGWSVIDSVRGEFLTNPISFGVNFSLSEDMLAIGDPTAGIYFQQSGQVTTYCVSPVPNDSWVWDGDFPADGSYDGRFSETAAWSPNGTPDGEDVVQFDVRATYDVTFTNDAAVCDLRMLAGDVTFRAPCIIIFRSRTL